MSSSSLDLLMEAIEALAESTTQLQLTVDPTSSFLVPVSPSASSPTLACRPQYTSYELEFFQMWGHLPYEEPHGSMDPLPAASTPPPLASREGWITNVLPLLPPSLLPSSYGFTSKYIGTISMLPQSSTSLLPSSYCSSSGSVNTTNILLPTSTIPSSYDDSIFLASILPQLPSYFFLDAIYTKMLLSWYIDVYICMSTFSFEWSTMLLPWYINIYILQLTACLSSGFDPFHTAITCST